MMNKIRTYIRPDKLLISDHPYLLQNRIENSIEIQSKEPVTIFIDHNQCVYETDINENKSDSITVAGIRSGRWFKKTLKGNGRWQLLPGDIISVYHCSIYYGKRDIRICGDYRTNLRPAASVEPEELVTENYKRSPRIKEIPIHQVIALDVTKTGEYDHHQSLLKRILPSLGMIITTIVIGLMTRRGLMILMCGFTSGIIVIISLADAIHDRREKKSRQAAYEAAAKDEILEAKRQFGVLKVQEESRMMFDAPSPQKICQMINEKSSRLYERRVGDEDFMRAAIGRSVGVSHIMIKSPKINSLNNETNAWTETAEELSKASLQTEEVLTIDLCGSSIGMAGSIPVLTNQLHSLILSLCFFHSYHDLQIIVMADDPMEELKWMGYLPHTRLSAVQSTGILTTARLQEQTGTRIEKLLKDRKQHAWQEHRQVHFVPHLLFIVRDPKMPYHPELMQHLLSEERHDYSVIWLAETEDALPENVTTLISYQDPAHGILRSVDQQAVNRPFVPYPLIRTNQLEWAARNLNVYHHQSEINSGIPAVVDFMKMLQDRLQPEMNFVSFWEQADPSKSLAVPLGFKDKTRVMKLDLHEKAHGPHGLIAGTTGSGKSELLQSLVLSLAVHFSPFDVGFLLIDYKGGGMADVFKGLPHLMGTITNLEAAEGIRAMSSIKAELIHRQTLFHDCHVNHIDEYMTIYKKGIAAEPLPHLIMICDEFAELKKEQGEIISELVSTARLGRSLGIHLILATQKPAGVVDDQIWSNTRFRIALRMAEEADSKEILKTPDAAGIKNPGRAYLQVGNNEIYELFQSAYSSGIYDTTQEDDEIENVVYRVNDLGQRIKIDGVKSCSKYDSCRQTEVRYLVDAMRKAFDQWMNSQTGRMLPHQPWLPVLNSVIKIPERGMQNEEMTGCRNHKGITDLTISLGVLDLPQLQMQITAKRDLMQSGHIAYFASEGFGKTTWLITQALSMAERYPPSMLQYYMLDLSGGSLIRMKALAHTADYIAMDDEEKFARFKRLITEELKRRKQILARQNDADIKAYNKNAKSPMRIIIIMIDQADAISEMGPEAEELLHKTAREGTALGVILMMTFGRSGGVRYATLSHIGLKLAGYMHDQSDIVSITGTSKLQPEEIPGRCLMRQDKQYERMQLFTAVSSEAELREEIERINAYYDGERAEPIAMMPKEVDLSVIQHMISAGKNGLTQIRKSAFDFVMGLTLDTVMPVGIIRNEMPLLILGDAGRGKTNALRLILQQIAGRASCYLVDARKKALYDVRTLSFVKYRDSALDKQVILRELNQLAKIREAALHDELMSGALPSEAAARLDEIWLMIDDIDDLITGMDVKMLEDLAESLAILINTGACMIVTANPQKLKGYDPVTRFVKGIQNGLLLSGQGTHNIFPLRSYKDEPDKLNGIIFRSGMTEKIRVAKGESIDE